MKNFTAGQYVNQGTYKSFQPENINRQWHLDNPELMNLLSQADRQLGRLDMYSEYIPNVDLFISMHVLKEATQSSKIEGTKTNMEEALLDKKDVAEEQKNDWEEVQNYISALNSAITDLKKLPLSSRMIKKTHGILLKGVRGAHKVPGEFRNSQNWIGGATISDAVFVPPVHSSVNDYMGDLEKFAHNKDYYFADLLKIALIHYQFETIHPFLDGNGRVGRLMITLYLMEKGILKMPVLYLSDFLEKNKTIYYENLMRVREKNDLNQWFKFFLVGVIETAKSSIETFNGILKLQREVDQKLRSLGSRFNKAQTLMAYLYQRPLIKASKAKEIIGLSLPSAYKLISDLEKLKLIREITGAKKDKLYMFEDYLDLFM